MMNNTAQSIQTLPFTALRQAADCLKVLAHPVRLRILSILKQEQYTVGDLATLCGIKSHVASGHLTLMQRYHLLEARRVGTQVFYRISEKQVLAILECIEKRFLDSL